MGSPPSEKDRSSNESQVDMTIERGFWMGEYEVTQQEYETVMGKNPSWFSQVGSGSAVLKQVKVFDTERFPLENVSWDDAVLFCKKLTEQE